MNVVAHYPLPRRWLSAAELPRTLFELARLPLAASELAKAPRGNGSPVLIIPGFAFGPRSTAPLRSYLNWLGHDARDWGLGSNLGAKTIGIDNQILIDRLDAIHAETGQQLTLIGWSMGGIIARMIARARPRAVRRVITLGAPFAGDPFANNAWRVYERLSGHSLKHPIAQAQIAESKLPMPVPSLAIHSKSDGVVSWGCCLEPERANSRNEEVGAPHCGLGFNVQVMRRVAVVLARP